MAYSIIYLFNIILYMLPDLCIEQDIWPIPGQPCKEGNPFIFNRVCLYHPPLTPPFSFSQKSGLNSLQPNLPVVKQHRTLYISSWGFDLKEVSSLSESPLFYHNSFQGGSSLFFFKNHILPHSFFSQSFPREPTPALHSSLQDFHVNKAS